jgi:pimeloyl-ACP methyl ester carboxylesterase
MRRLFRGLAWSAIGAILTAVLLFLAFPLLSWRRESLERHAAAPRGTFVRAADAEVFVQQAGPADGPPVVLIHGTGAWSEIWRDTIDSLAASGFRVVAIDVPPFGYSERLRGRENFTRDKQARRILAVLDALGIEKATLVGHSVGSRPTIEAAAQAPSRVQALVLVDPALGIEPAPPSGTVQTLVDSPRLFRATVASTGTNPLLTSRLFRSFVARVEAVTSERVRMLQQPLRVAGTTAAQSEWLSMVMTDADSGLTVDPSKLRSIGLPVLLVWGRDDTVTPLRQGVFLATTLPNADLAIIEGAGHIPFIEAPVEFNRTLRRYLRLHSK